MVMIDESASTCDKTGRSKRNEAKSIKLATIPDESSGANHNADLLHIAAGDFKEDAVFEAAVCAEHDTVRPGDTNLC